MRPSRWRGRWATTCAPAARIWQRCRRGRSGWTATARSARGGGWARRGRGRGERARRAVAAERARIARELHDVISHNVSVMVVQAAAGGDVFESRPERAREVLGSIESTGREALAELRRLLGVVRPAEDAPAGDYAPSP